MEKSSSVTLRYDSGSFIFIGFFHIGFGLSCLTPLLLLSAGALVPLSEPTIQIQLFRRVKNRLKILKDRHFYRAVRALFAFGLHKIDGGVAHEIGDEQVAGPMVYRQGRLILLQHAVIDQTDLGGQGSWLPSDRGVT